MYYQFDGLSRTVRYTAPMTKTPDLTDLDRAVFKVIDTFNVGTPTSIHRQLRRGGWGPHSQWIDPCPDATLSDVYAALAALRKHGWIG